MNWYLNRSVGGGRSEMATDQLMVSSSRMSPDAGWDTEADLARMIAPQQPSLSLSLSAQRARLSFNSGSNGVSGFASALDVGSSNNNNNDGGAAAPRILRQSSSTGSTISSLTSPRGSQNSPTSPQGRISGLTSPNSMAAALRGAALSAVATSASTVAARGAVAGAGLVTSTNANELLGVGPSGPAPGTTRHLRASSEDAGTNVCSTPLSLFLLVIC
jgi:hypothetical protein